MRIIYSKPRRSIMHRLNSPLLALVALAAFVALISYAYPVEHGYTEEERAGMDALHASLDRPMTPAEAIIYLYGDE